MATAQSVSSIDILPLFGPPSRARDAVDRGVMAAAADSGFMMITGLPEDIGIDAATRSNLLRLFQAPRKITNTLSRNQHDPSRPLVYRGWFELTEGRPFYYQGMAIGPDVAHGRFVLDPADPLRGATPMPSESDLPGWRTTVRDYYLGMECVADALICSIARGLGVPEESISRLFVDGISTLRLLRYPVRSSIARARVAEEQLYVHHDCRQREVISEAHVDFGFMTLLAQDETGGLQARMPDGPWIDIPPVEKHLVVNFGKLLERWTSGRIRATEHRVLSPGRERFSLPFFYEPHVDAEIKPLPLTDAEQFASFLYGDHVWASIPRLRRHFGDRPIKQTIL